MVEIRWPFRASSKHEDGQLLLQLERLEDEGEVIWQPSSELLSKPAIDLVNLWQYIRNLGNEKGFLPVLPTVDEVLEAAQLMTPSSPPYPQLYSNVDAWRAQAAVEDQADLQFQALSLLARQIEQTEDNREVARLLRGVVDILRPPPASGEQGGPGTARSDDTQLRTVAAEVIRALRPQLEERGKYNDNREEYEKVWALVDSLGREIRKFLTSIQYLEPMRSKPRRVYYVPRASARRVDGHGQETIENLLALHDTAQWEEAKERVNRRLADLKFGIEFDAFPLRRRDDPDNLAFEVTLEEVKSKTRVTLSDTGLGWSQFLPVLVECVLAQPGTLIVIEEPEAHLHPSAQAELGSLFAYLAYAGGMRFLIETHSEDLILRLRRLLAQTALDKHRQQQSSLPLVPTDLSVYFVERSEEEGVSRCEAIEYDRWGQ